MIGVKLAKQELKLETSSNGSTAKHPEQDLKPERTIHEIQRFLYSLDSR